MNKRTKKLLLAMMSNDARIREVSGTPPLTYKAKNAGTLTDYRIYGQTENGESVGDRTKNLLQNTATSQTINGVTFTVNEDGSVTCNGTATQTVIYMLNDTFSLEPGTYNLTGCPAGGGYADKYKLDIVAPPTAYGTDKGDGSSFTLSSTLTNAQYRIVIYNNQTCNNLTFYPMIRLASIEDDTYEPYGYKVPVTVEGKNLLQNTATSQTINGVTFTVNSDGSVTCNGTSTAQAYIRLTSDSSGIPFNAGRYIVSQSCDSTLFGYIDWTVNGVNQARTKNDELELTFNENSNISAWVNITPNKTCNNLTFYPMIRKADIEDDTYEPYQPPVTTPIYLPEQIRKVGDEAEYIDFGEQKQYFADGTSADVTLPALPTVAGTNTLSVGTEVQPSEVEIEGRIKPVVTGGD